MRQEEVSDGLYVRLIRISDPPNISAIVYQMACEDCGRELNFDNRPAAFTAAEEHWCDTENLRES